MIMIGTMRFFLSCVAVLGMVLAVDVRAAAQNPSGSSTPTPSPTPVFYAARPILYVMYGSSAYGQTTSAASATGPASGPSVGANGKGASTTGNPSNPGAPTTNIDNPSALLLYEVAKVFNENVVANHEYNGPMVVPEPFWTMPQFAAQCQADNEDLSKAQLKGTIGAIVLTGATVTQDGEFNLITVKGRSHAQYFGELLDCLKGDPLRNQTSSSPTNIASEIWSGAAEGQAKPAVGISFFPIAAGGTALAAYETARTTIHPAPGATAQPYLINQYLYNQTALAIGTFAAATSAVIFGNPTSQATLRDSFRLLANDMGNQVRWYCKEANTTKPNFCSALAVASPTPSPLP